MTAWKINDSLCLLYARCSVAGINCYTSLFEQRYPSVSTVKWIPLSLQSFGSTESLIHRESEYVVSTTTNKFRWNTFIIVLLENWKLLVNDEFVINKPVDWEDQSNRHKDFKQKEFGYWSPIPEGFQSTCRLNRISVMCAPHQLIGVARPRNIRTFHSRIIGYRTKLGR